MNQWICIGLLLLAVFLLLLSYYGTTKVSGTPFMIGGKVAGQLNCQLIEYSQPPDDTDTPPTVEEVQQLQDAAAAFDSDGSADGDADGNADGDADGDADANEDFRIHRGGRGGGRGRRHGGGGGWWPWRPWPRRHWGRPWRSGWWRTYPQYVYTYPMTYYTPTFVAPVQRFTIRVGPKTEDHPFYGQGSNVGFTVMTGRGAGCGTSGARIDLIRGRTYEFDVYTNVNCETGQSEDEPLFFTTSQMGGNTREKLFDITPTSNGTIRITITDNLPGTFYYQSTNGKFVGGYVILSSS